MQGEQQHTSQRAVSRRSKLLVLVDSQYDYFRRILEGVSRYSPVNVVWRIEFGDASGLEAIESVTADACGLIATLGTAAMLERAALLKLPVINVSARIPEQPEGICRVVVDNTAVGRLGAEHLLELGLRRLAYFGDGGGFAAERAAGFEAACGEARVQCNRFSRDIKQLPTTVGSLQTPVGVMACEDQLAVRILTLVDELGWKVPDEVALVGVNNDLMGALASPPLSSVDPAGEQVGFEAARLMDRLLGGEAPPHRPVLVPPRGVVGRASTDVLAIDDEQVRHALDYIRTHACDGITGEHVLKQVRISRPTLEKRFKQALGRSVREEIRRVQFDHARKLLIETDLKISEVADRAGFAYFTRFTDQFSKQFGEPPSAFRQRYQRR